jgi:hypothetical protein
MSTYEDARDQWIEELEASNDALLEKCAELKALLSDAEARCARQAEVLSEHGVFFDEETPY